MSKRYFLEVVYDGTQFHGSQLQGNLPTVQYCINMALSTLLRKPVLSFGASRTDEGVHALSNFYHFDWNDDLHPHFHYKINAILSPAISVKNIFSCVEETLNARFDAVSRSYRYKIYNQKNPFYQLRGYYFPYKLHADLLNQTAAIIRSQTCFESFSKRNTQSKTFNCQIFDSFWEQVDDQLHFVVRANRFLRGMVRGLVGTQLQVGRGKISVSQFQSIVDAHDCTQADFSVPGHGLYLEEIRYPQDSIHLLDLM
ncbi:MAG: tRNA pseudouridine(38-40) synthase TruA [Bacteroidetes bacterium]|nr:tRNA pseudouridine(38-40) synthase TruA [Bacteroidota bacterium]